MSRRSRRWRGPRPVTRPGIARSVRDAVAPPAGPSDLAAADPTLAERDLTTERVASPGPAVEREALAVSGSFAPRATFVPEPERAPGTPSPGGSQVPAGDPRGWHGNATGQVMRPWKAPQPDGGSNGTAPAVPAGTPGSSPGVGDGAIASVGPETRPSLDAPTPDGGGQAPGGCTAAQLRRFIKSRAYVPLHELRRRFELNGAEDDVSPIDLDGRRLFVGLPGREAQLLNDLLRSGDVGYELLLDPTSPLVVGVFPMRPVPRA